MGSLKNWTNIGADTASPEKATENDTSTLSDTSEVSITECSSSPTGKPISKDETVEEPEKENFTPNKSYNVVLCGRAPMLLTSFSPAPDTIENYASVVANLTPKSVYSTPNKGDDEGEFSTPNHSSVYLVDLTTTPKTKAPSTPTPALRYTAVQGFSSSPIVVSDTDTSSDDLKSAPSSTSVSKSPEQTPKRVLSAVNATPKRTPQSLMKRAILTSAKKAGHTPSSRRSLLGISEKSRSIVKRAPQITPRMNKLTEDRLNFSLQNQQESKPSSPSSSKTLKWTPDKKSPKRVLSVTKATPDAIKALSRKSMSAVAASRKSMFTGSAKSTPKPSISALRKSMVALSKSKTPVTATMVKNDTCDSELTKTSAGTSANDTCDMEGISDLMKTPAGTSANDTCDMEGISELMKTPVALERSRTFIVDTPNDKVFNSSMSKNMMMAMSPNQSINVGSDVCKDTMDEINTTVDVNSTIEISGIGDDLLKEEVIVDEVSFLKPLY